MHTHFAPAEREPRSEVRRQSRLFPHSPVLARFLDAVPSIVTVLNRQRQIVFANRRLFEFLGIAPSATDAVYGRRPGEVLACSHAFEEAGGCGTTRFCSACGAVKAILSSQKMAADMQECRIIQTPCGRALELRAWATPLRVEEELFTIFVAVDIGHEKRRIMLERLFFHDVLNTAGGLKGAVELIRGANPAELDELQGIIFGLTDTLIDEIQAQRQLAAAENNELAMNPVTVDAAALLEEVAAHYARHEVAGGLRLRVAPDAWMGSLVTERTLLKRVVGNMVKNALEASQAGDTVWLGCEKGGEGVTFWVRNPGFIPEKTQLQIFNRSFSTKGSGRGLGTYSIKLFTEQYLKGSASFTSSPNEGTTFRVRLPADRVVDSAAEAADPGAAAPASKPLDILLVDDNRINRRLAAALLERCGHTVTVCEDGRRAVDLAFRRTFDLVLMDVQMPGMDGLAATRAIRAREAGLSVRLPILAMTGLTDGADLVRCLDAGMDGWVPKPFRPEDLDRFMRGRSGPSEKGEKAPGAAPLDSAEMLATMGGDAALMRELAGMFLEQAPGLLDAVRRAAASGDGAALERSAHQLKGAVANFSAHDAVSAAERLERAGRDGDQAFVPPGLARLEAELDRLTTALRGFVEGDGC